MVRLTLLVMILLCGLGVGTADAEELGVEIGPAAEVVPASIDSGATAWMLASSALVA